MPLNGDGPSLMGFHYMVVGFHYSVILGKI
jgi:hypothetical protein